MFGLEPLTHVANPGGITWEPVCISKVDLWCPAVHSLTLQADVSYLIFYAALKCLTVGAVI